MDGATDKREMRLNSPLPLIAWVALLITQLISPDKAWSSLLVALGALIGLAFLWARSLRDGVSADRHTLGTWVIMGDRLHERWTLGNAGLVPVLWARVRDCSEMPGYRVDRVETAPGQGSRTWTTAGTCVRRGVFRLGPWFLEMSDPLGFFTVRQEYTSTTTITVYPRAAFLPDIQLPKGVAPGRSRSSDRSFDETVQIGSLRNYVPGDSLRRIAWRATAHHERMLVHEYDREPSGDVWLILDLDERAQAGDEAEATQEYAVILGASLATHFLRQGERRAVGLLMAGRSPVILPPAHGEAQLWRIIEALAEAEPEADLALADLLSHSRESLGAGMTQVLITPSLDPSWVAALLPLQNRGNAATVVLLDATTFDPPSGSPESVAGMRALLAQHHIPVTLLAQGFPFRPVERLRRQRSELKSLSGFGRVIRVDVEEEV